jgi:hypothetical protein
METGQVKVWLRGCAIILFISACGMALGHALFGHAMVDLLYKGTTGTFLDGIITGRQAHPIEYFYAELDRRVLRWTVRLCLLTWGLLAFACTSSTLLLVLLLSADVLFVVLEYLYGATAGFQPSDFAIGQDWGYAETFQYVKELGIVIFFFRFLLRNPYLVSLGWQILFLYLLLDDALLIHERWGRFLAEHMFMPPETAFEARAFRALSDHAVSAFFGLLILGFLSVGYYRAPQPLKKVSRHLFGLFISLILFGVLLDSMHQVLGAYVPNLFMLGYVLEEAGEMVMISVIAWYVHRLVTDVPRRFPLASP